MMEGINNHGNSIGIAIGLRVYAKPSKVLRFMSLLQGMHRWKSIGNKKPSVSLRCHPNML
jgi:hypothetical protein